MDVVIITIICSEVRNGADQTLVRSVCVIGTIAYGDFISAVRLAMGPLRLYERVAIDLRGI